MLTSLALLALLSGFAAFLAPPVLATNAGLPTSSWMGARFFLAAMLLILGLYGGNVILNIPLSALWIVFGATAMTGFVVGIRRIWRTPPGDALVMLIHPVWIFNILVAVLVAIRGAGGYLPFTGDEVTSWLWLARQMFLVDAYWSDLVVYHHGGYTNGWPLALAFTSSLIGLWDDAHAALLPFLIHVGLLGLIYDVLFDALRRQVGRKDVARVLAWIGVLGLLAVEASWLLVPRFVLIDEPVLYVLLALFVISVVGLESPQSRRRIAIYIGLILAGGYLLKISILSAIPALAVVGLAYIWRDPQKIRNGVLIAGAMLIPIAGAAASWSVFRTAEECNASPFDLFGMADFTAERFDYIASLYMRSAVSYIATYKWPVTLVAFGCLIAALTSRRTAWLVAAVAVFIVAYSSALFLSYFSCIEIVEDNLASFQRYFLVNLRVIHVIGPLAIAIALLDSERARDFIERAWTVRGLRTGAYIVIAVLLAVQAWSAWRSLADQATRVHQDKVQTTSVVTLKHQAQQLKVVLAHRKLANPRVSIIAQGGYSVEHDFAYYFGLKERPDASSNHDYSIVPPFAWAPGTTGAFTTQTSASTLLNFWRTFDVLWPYRTDDWTRSILRQLVTDETCATEPERYFLIRVSQGAPSIFFECVLKDG